MSDEHRAANAKAREENRAVGEYLEALEAHKPKRGRQRTAESIRNRMEAISDALESAAPIRRVQLIQERIDLERALSVPTEDVDISALEDRFVDVAVSYSGRKGITYAAWREVNVPASVLKRAGITRGGA
ncbi:MAG: hypothetical protein OXE79_05580 [Acidimicrobiaceae bacterium]|nr:hypothetical protein [Acidimicrobiaceae bacterium]MCY4176213.1 hypothetical protein [Acidimicrobiaceae bacterium]MCY4280194.1 hypothetical protein [Acidimicrobiaceae bacterium]MCY4293624.1 hypothetical protein [Acidimicrobiaceae bacterium]